MGCQRMVRRLSYHGVGATHEEAEASKRAAKRDDIPVVPVGEMEGMTGDDVDALLCVRLEKAMNLCYEMNSLLLQTAGGVVPQVFGDVFRDSLFTVATTLDDLRDALEPEATTIGGWAIQLARKGHDTRAGKFEFRPRAK